MLVIRKTEKLPIVATLMDLEITIPNEVSQREISYDITKILKNIYTNKLICKTERLTDFEKNSWLPKWKGGEEG